MNRNPRVSNVHSEHFRRNNSLDASARIASQCHAEADLAIQRRMLRETPERPRCGTCSGYLDVQLPREGKCPHCGDVADGAS